MPKRKKKMKFDKITEGLNPLFTTGNTGVDIAGLSCDSREIRSSWLFIAVPGHDGDGHSYIAKALENGASAVLYSDASYDGILTHAGVAGVRVASSREALAHAADNFYAHPSRELTLVGITGTNGKTSTVTLLYGLFTKMGYSCGLLSTIANYVGQTRLETTNTTSDPITTNRLMAEMVRQGCAYCFMEVSSIGAEQDRVKCLDFDIAIFSNLTHDHLDYHGSFAEYIRCKKLFFDQLKPQATAIVNADDSHSGVMVQNCRAKVQTYGLRSPADHNCRIMEQSFDGMALKIDGQEVWTRLIGRHNAYNLLAIYCAALAAGASKDEILVGLSGLKAAPGRLEVMRGPRDISAVIDYAHTPDALENVLSTLKEVGPRRQLICLFGCGGDRDRSKRPEMAAVVQKYADRIFVTSDNSRSEKTEDILDDIRQGFDSDGLARSLFIPDRKEAIRAALTLAPDGATVLLAGKGHETYQITGKEKLHFDEKEIVEEIFKQMQ